LNDCSNNLNLSDHVRFYAGKYGKWKGNVLFVMTKVNVSEIRG